MNLGVRRVTRISDAAPPARAALPDLSLPVRVLPLAQYVAGRPWALTLMQDHAHHMLIWITRGQGRVTINATRRGIGAHNAVFLPAGTLFSLDLAPQSLAQVLVADVAPGQTLPEAPVHIRHRDGLAQAELTGMLDSLHRETVQGQSMVDTALAAHLSLVSVWLHRAQAAGFGDSADPKAAHRLMGRYARRVVARYATGDVMADFARALDVTPTHLTRVCRASCGLSAAEVLTQRRVFAARHLLNDHKKPVKHIAQELGFSSAAYFTRFVQQHTGKSPTALRNGKPTKDPLRNG